MYLLLPRKVLNCNFKRRSIERHGSDTKRNIYSHIHNVSGKLVRPIFVFNVLVIKALENVKKIREFVYK